MARDVLFTNLKRIIGDDAPRARAAKRKSAAKGKTAPPIVPIGCKAIQGAAQVQRVLEVDQAPIGKDAAVLPCNLCWLLG